jgi:hypothetical protein
MNPECAAGKHDNCDGKAWRDDLNDIGSCRCGCHDQAIDLGFLSLPWELQEGLLADAAAQEAERRKARPNPPQDR